MLRPGVRPRASASDPVPATIASKAPRRPEAGASRSAAGADMATNAGTDPEAVVRRFIDEGFLRGDFSAVDELVTDDFQAHTWGPMPPGRDGLKQGIERVSAGLSDASMTIDDLISQDDRVAVRLTSSATQTGPFMGLPPSGKRYEIGEIHWFRVRDGRIAEHWHQADFLGMLRQLGAMPGGGGAMAGSESGPGTAGSESGPAMAGSESGPAH